MVKLHQVTQLPGINIPQNEQFCEKSTITKMVINMKIRIALVSEDLQYVKRLTNSLDAKYFESVTVCSYSSLEAFLNALSTTRIDVALISETFEYSHPVNARYASAILCVDRTRAGLEGKRCIEKYQRVEMIYKEIVDLFSEIAGSASFDPENGEISSRVIGFFSPGTGSGATSVSLAFAKTLAASGRRVLYLSYSHNDNSDLVLSDEGHHSMSDIIRALKSKKTNLKLKLSSNLKHDASGVYFYSVCNNLLDYYEFTDEEKVLLLKTFATTANTPDETLQGFDFIILDFEFVISDACAEMLKMMYKIYAVVSVNDSCEKKFKRLYDVLPYFEEQRGINFLGRLAVICNKCPRNLNMIQTDANVVGSIPLLPDKPFAETVNSLCSAPVFRQLEML